MSNTLPGGLRQNWPQFMLLVGVNALVGGMVGLERSIVPQLAKTEFGVQSASWLLSFIVAFGLSKAVANYASGVWANRLGRKNLLVAGWLVVLPQPFILFYAPNWTWVIGANVLLGINQGLTWSSTVGMKLDLAGQKHRGLAAGLNEFAGYLAVGLAAWYSSHLAEQYGARPVLVYAGLGLALAGTLISLLFVKDTGRLVRQEQQKSTIPMLKHPFWAVTWGHQSLGAISQAGLVNNLNDGLLWGLLPVLLSQHLSTSQVGLVAALYPGVWGVSQLATGSLADRFPVRALLLVGMLVQGVGLLALITVRSATSFGLLTSLIGLGTALVYPTFLVAIAQHTNPVQRATCLGTFRLWRDFGYVVGALLSGFLADRWGVPTAIVTVGILTGVSGLVAYIRLDR